VFTVFYVFIINPSPARVTSAITTPLTVKAIRAGMLFIDISVFFHFKSIASF